MEKEFDIIKCMNEKLSHNTEGFTPEVEQRWRKEAAERYGCDPDDIVFIDEEKFIEIQQLNNKIMKTSKRIKIGWAVFCTIVAIALCVAVVSEWKAKGVDMMFSLVAGCIVYCAGCIGMFILGKEAVDFVDYWWFDGDEYYKGRKKV